MFSDAVLAKPCDGVIQIVNGDIKAISKTSLSGQHVILIL